MWSITGASCRRSQRRAARIITQQERWRPRVRISGGDGAGAARGVLTGRRSNQLPTPNLQLRGGTFKQGNERAPTSHSVVLPPLFERSLGRWELDVGS